MVSKEEKYMVGGGSPLSMMYSLLGVCSLVLKVGVPSQPFSFGHNSFWMSSSVVWLPGWNLNRQIKLSSEGRVPPETGQLYIRVKIEPINIGWASSHLSYRGNTEARRRDWLRNKQAALDWLYRLASTSHTSLRVLCSLSNESMWNSLPTCKAVYIWNILFILLNGLLPRITISSEWKRLSQERPGLSGASGGKQRVSKRSHVQERTLARFSGSLTTV